jgi:glycerate-2-kinase
MRPSVKSPVLIKNFPSLATTPERRAALRILNAGIDAVLPQNVVRQRVRLTRNKLSIDNKSWNLNDYRRIWIVGAGKGAAGYAAELERVLGNKLTGGAVIDTKPATLRHIRFLKGDHPVPSKRNVEATRALLDIVNHLHPDDLLICLFTGGGSALFEDSHIPLDQLQTLTKRLLRSGATIHEINTVRKHLSHVKGGRLARLAWPATVITLLVSDVIGDDVGMIASGPTAREPSTTADAARILQKYHIKAPRLIETPKEARYYRNVTYHLLVTNTMAVDAMRHEARRLGFSARVLTTRLSGEARDIGVALARRRIPSKTALIAAGETTVTVKGNGTGGRNEELALGALGHLRAVAAIASLDSDGVDFIKQAAGAIVSWDDQAKALKKRLNAKAFLARNDSYHFFKKLGRNLIVTGPTGTNVADLVVVVRN